MRTYAPKKLVDKNGILTTRNVRVDTPAKPLGIPMNPTVAKTPEPVVAVVAPVLSVSERLAKLEEIESAEVRQSPQEIVKALKEAARAERYGFDRETGIHRETGTKLTKHGFDARGVWDDPEHTDGTWRRKEYRDAFDFDSNGLNPNGFYRTKIHKETGTDRDPAGRNWLGQDEHGFMNKAWYPNDADSIDPTDLSTRKLMSEHFRNWSTVDENNNDFKGFSFSNRIHMDTGTPFDTEGFDAAGFDSDGYNRDGYNRDGFNRDGLDRYGRDRSGFKDGTDKEGFDHSGFKDGFDRDGFDVNGFGRTGLNKEGYNAEGYDRWGWDSSERNRDGFDRKGFDRDGFNAAGWNPDGLNKATRTLHDPDGFDKDGRDTLGFNREGFNGEGFNAEGYQRNGRDSEGRDRDGFGFVFVDAPHYYMGNHNHRNKKELDREGFDREGFDLSGRDREGFDQAGHDRAGFKLGAKFDRNGRDRKGFDRDGLDRDGYNRKGYDAEGWNRKNLNVETGTEYDAKGFNRNGLNAAGVGARGGRYGKDGYDAQDYNRAGVGRDGIRRENRDAWNNGSHYQQGWNINGEPDMVHDLNVLANNGGTFLKSDLVGQAYYGSGTRAKDYAASVARIDKEREKFDWLAENHLIEKSGRGYKLTEAGWERTDWKSDGVNRHTGNQFNLDGYSIKGLDRLGFTRNAYRNVAGLTRAEAELADANGIDSDLMNSVISGENF